MRTVAPDSKYDPWTTVRHPPVVGAVAGVNNATMGGGLLTVVVTGGLIPPIPKGATASRYTNAADSWVPTRAGSAGRFSMAFAFPTAFVVPLNPTNTPGSAAPYELNNSGGLRGKLPSGSGNGIPGDV